jgi:hypothetical protein
MNGVKVWCIRGSTYWSSKHTPFMTGFAICSTARMHLVGSFSPLWFCSRMDEAMHHRSVWMTYLFYWVMGFLEKGASRRFRDSIYNLLFIRDSWVDLSLDEMSLQGSCKMHVCRFCATFWMLIAFCWRWWTEDGSLDSMHIRVMYMIQKVIDGLCSLLKSMYIFTYFFFSWTPL